MHKSSKFTVFMTTVLELQPSDQTCKENGNATFDCQPVASLNIATLNWTVNGSFINGSSSNGSHNFVETMSGAISHLEFRGCLLQWDRTRVQCILTLSTGETIYSDPAILSVEPGKHTVVLQFCVFKNCFN